MKTAPKIILPVLVFFITILLAILGLNAIFLTEKPPKPIFLKVVGFWDPKVFNSLKKEFQAKNPEITVEYEQKNQERYFANLKADLVSPKNPDVFWWHSGWGPELASHLASIPASVLTTSDYENIYYPVTKNEGTDMKINGTYRGIPLEIDGLALLYNKTTLAASNFSEPPQTWLTLREKYVPALNRADSKRIFTSAIALGSVENVESFSEIIGLFLLQNGVEFTKNGELIFSKGTLAVDAINFYFQFSKKTRSWDNTQPNNVEAFAKGKTAMILLPVYKIPQLLAVLKNENLVLNFGIAPVPQLPESVPVTWGSYWALGVGQNSLEKGSAWKLVKFLSSPESLRQVYAQESAANGIGRAYPRVEMAKEQTTNQYLAPYLTQAPDARSWFLQGDTFDNGLNDLVIAEFTSFLGAVETGKTSSNSVGSLAKKINPILIKYGVTTKPVPK